MGRRRGCSATPPPALLGEAEWMHLYGCRRNSRRLEPISRSENRETQFVEDGAALKRYWDTEPLHTQVHVCRRDLRRRMRELTMAAG